MENKNDVSRECIDHCNRDYAECEDCDGIDEEISEKWVVEENFLIDDWVAICGDDEGKLITLESEQAGLDEIDEIDKVYYSELRVRPLTKETKLRDGLSLTDEQTTYLAERQDKLIV